MNLIDFNSSRFSGFQSQENILVDTGVLLAYVNEYDAWHNTVANLFEKHIFVPHKELFLAITPRIVDEALHIAEKPLEQYGKKHPSEFFTPEEVLHTKERTKSTIQELIKKDVLIILDGSKESVLLQIELQEKLGSTDALNCSIAATYGLNFLTVDNRLAKSVPSEEARLPDIATVYFTTPQHRTY